MTTLDSDTQSDTTSDATSPSTGLWSSRGAKRTGAGVIIVMLVFGIILIAAGTLSSSTTRSTSVTLGSVSLSVTTTGGYTGSITDTFSAATPGSSHDRVFGVANSGTVPFNQVVLSMAGSVTVDPDTATNVLTDTNGLKVQIYRCSGTYSGAPGSYVCSGTETEMTSGATRPTTISNLPISATQAASTTVWYRVVEQLPTNVPNATQGESGSLTYNIDATVSIGGQR